jgi:hypothetical protein
MHADVLSLWAPCLEVVQRHAGGATFTPVHWRRRVTDFQRILRGGEVMTGERRLRRDRCAELRPARPLPDFFPRPPRLAFRACARAPVRLSDYARVFAPARWPARIIRPALPMPWNLRYLASRVSNDGCNQATSHSLRALPRARAGRQASCGRSSSTRTRYAPGTCFS